ncbi:MAG: hypothetical protein LC722_04065 [Actinobacteria bacterium]|nr:hypothetical protein [Actinomycetota bacterium]
MKKFVLLVLLVGLMAMGAGIAQAHVQGADIDYVFINGSGRPDLRLVAAGAGGRPPSDPHGGRLLQVVQRQGPGRLRLTRLEHRTNEGGLRAALVVVAPKSRRTA